jgi:hypothetical protein
VTTSGTTTTTVYVGDIEQVATSGGTTTTTTYYDSAGQRIARAGVGRRMELLDTIHRAPLIGLHAPTHACGARTVR